mgnify:CR=1 FL=1
MENPSQQPIRILIIEDDPISAESLVLTLQEFGYEIKGVAHTIEAALILLNRESFDIALVDIDLNGSKSGIEIGALLSNLYRLPYIFITGISDTSVINEAIKAKPAAYLQKPSNPATIFASIQNALQNFSAKAESSYGKQAEADFFFIKNRNKLVKINWNEIVLLTSSDNYTVLTTLDKKDYFIRSSLAMTLKFQIPASLRSNFIQVNRAEVVQIPFIAEIFEDEISTPVKKIAITGSFMKEVKQKLNIIN